MIELRDDARFTIESLAELRVGCEGGGKDLDRDDAIQAHVARAIHLAHAPRREETLDPVGAEGRTRLQRRTPRDQSRSRSRGPRLFGIGFVVIHEQTPHLAAQLVVALAGVAYEGLALSSIPLQCVLEDLLNAPRAVHCGF